MIGTTQLPMAKAVERTQDAIAAGFPGAHQLVFIPQPGVPESFAEEGGRRSILVREETNPIRREQLADQLDHWVDVPGLVG